MIDRRSLLDSTERLASAKVIKKERYRSEEHGKFNLSGPEFL